MVSIKEENNFERVKLNCTKEKREEINKKIKDGLLKWSFYSVDGENSYNYYLKIKKK